MHSGEEAQTCSWCLFSEGSIILALGNPPDPIPMPACKEHWLSCEGKLALSLLPAPMQLWKAGKRSLALQWDQRHLLCYPAFDHGVTSVQKPCAIVLKGAGVW